MASKPNASKGGRPSTYTPELAERICDLILAHGLDEVFAPVIHFQIFQSITICAYAAGEFGSIIETLERGGLGGAVPPVLRRLVKTLNERIEARAEEELSKRGLTVEKEKDHD